MIKEITFKATLKNEYLYNSIKIDTIMEQPFKLNIEIFKEIDYFHEKLNNAHINIINGIPKADWISVDRWTRLVCVSVKNLKKFSKIN